MFKLKHQPVLSSVDDSSHMICNIPLCAFKIEILQAFVYFSIPAVWISKLYGQVKFMYGQVEF